MADFLARLGVAVGLRHRGLTRGLRIRLVASTLAVTVVAVAIAAYVAHRETRNDVLGEVRREADKPREVRQALELHAVTAALRDVDPWAAAELEPVVDAEAASSGLEIAVRRATGELLAASSPAAAESAAQAPVEAWLPVAAAADELGRWQDYNNALAACYDGDPGTSGEVGGKPAVSVPWNGVPNRRTGVVETRKDVAAFAPGALGGEQNRRAAQCQLRAGDGFTGGLGRVEVWVSPTRLQTGTFLSDGVNGRFVVAFGLVAVLTVVVGAVIARRILRPIGELTFAAHMMARGDLDQRVDVRRNDEIGELAGAFNSMAASLDEGARQRRRVTSDIAHELRTPLSNIRGYLEAVQDGVAPLTPALVASLYEDALLLQALVEDLQELAAAESGQLPLNVVAADLAELAGSVAAGHRTRAANSGVALNTALASPLWADVDPRRIRQVLTNLVENAVRHTDAGGEVVLRGVARGDMVELAVTDTGTGIAPEHLAHVFDRFYRADASRTRATGGSGLGLAIARQLVAAHGGTIEASSTLGVGTTFTVRLPRHGAGELAPGVDSAHQSASPASVYSIRG